MKFIPINHESSFAFAEKYASTVVENTRADKDGYSLPRSVKNHCDNLETLCETHPGNITLIRKYAEELTLLEKQSFGWSEYKILADTVHKVNSIHAAYPEDAEIAKLYLISLRYDAARVFPVRMKDSWSVICDEVDVLPKQSEEMTDETSDNTENTDNADDKENEEDESVEDEYFVSSWTEDDDDMWYLSQYLQELFANASLTYECHKETEGIAELYADVLSELAFRDTYSEHKDKRYICDGTVDSFLNPLKNLYDNTKNPHILYRYLEAFCSSIIRTQWYLEEEELHQHLQKTSAYLRNLISTITPSEDPELYGMYLRAQAAVISYYACTIDDEFQMTKEEFPEGISEKYIKSIMGRHNAKKDLRIKIREREAPFCKKIVDEIAGFFKLHNEDTDGCRIPRIAYGEVILGYMIPSGFYSKKKCIKAYRSLELPPIAYFGDEDEADSPEKYEIARLTERFEEVFEKSGWGTPSDYQQRYQYDEKADEFVPVPLKPIE